LDFKTDTPCQSVIRGHSMQTHQSHVRLARTKHKQPLELPVTWHATQPLTPRINRHHSQSVE